MAKREPRLAAANLLLGQPEARGLTMEWMQFVLSVVKSIVWPITVIVIVVILRQPLGALIPFVQRLRFKDFEVEFGERVGEINEEVANEFPEESEAILADAEGSKLIRLAEVSPRAAVLDAWLTIELSAVKAAKRISDDLPDSFIPVHKAVRIIESKGNVDRDMMGFLHELRELRNRAAHAPEFALSKESAVEYASSARTLARYLDRIRPIGG